MMSATSDSPRCGAASPELLVVRPTAVSESSILDSVAGFIETGNGAHRSAKSANSNLANEAVVWARFEEKFVDIHDLSHNRQDATPPLVLVVGYSRGVQIWLVAPDGEATLVSSWQQYSPIKSLRLLPRPLRENRDCFKDSRPLAALVDCRVDEEMNNESFTLVSFVSLSSGQVLKHVRFSSEVVDVSANARVVVVALRQKLALFRAHNLEPCFSVTSCYLSPGLHANPVALGDRFLAFADSQLVSIHRSLGGLESDHYLASMASWGINVGSKLAQGVSKFYTNLFTHNRAVPPVNKAVNSGNVVGPDSPQKGVVTVLDVAKVNAKEVNMSSRIAGVVAHFVAHTRAIVALEFDPSGSLLLTCDRYGNYFNLFRIVPHPSGARCAAVHHLYVLHRGDTPGSVQNISFSSDCRWVSVSTLRGTTHIFPITPYGGAITVRTHTSPTVVNKLSRFHRSAGIDENDPTPKRSSGRNSPNPVYGTSPGASMNQNDQSAVQAYPSPYVPPYPLPLIVQPLEQLRQPYIYTLVQNSPLMTSTRRRSASTSSTSSIEDNEVPVRLATCFAAGRTSNNATRGQRSPFFRVDSNKVKQNQQQLSTDSLFVLGNQGMLLEYALDIAPNSTLPKEKICESSPIEVRASPLGQWQLPPPVDRNELQPPFKSQNPLMGAYFNSNEVNKIDDDDEDDWLAYVEILTHVGPHRRLWMGPQFSFKTWRTGDDQQEELLGDSSAESSLKSLEVEVSNLDLDSKQFEEASVTQPMDILKSTTARTTHESRASAVIEACSASSLEYSPRFSSGSNDSAGRLWVTDHASSEINVETELHAAMAETVTSEQDDSFFDGSRSTVVTDKSEERFFSLSRDKEHQPKRILPRASNTPKKGSRNVEERTESRRRPENICEQSVEDLSSTATFSTVIKEVASIESLVAEAIDEEKTSETVNYLSDFSDNDSFPVLSPSSFSRSKRPANAKRSDRKQLASEEDLTTSEDDQIDVSLSLGRYRTESDEGFDQRQETASNDNGDGWSFETDDIDVARLVDEVVKADAEASKIALEDIFKFESEMGSKNGDDNCVPVQSRMAQSLDEGALVETSDAESNDVMTGSLSCGVSDVDDNGNGGGNLEFTDNTKERKTSRKGGKKKRRK